MLIYVDICDGSSDFGIGGVKWWTVPAFAKKKVGIDKVGELGTKNYDFYEKKISKRRGRGSNLEASVSYGSKDYDLHTLSPPCARLNFKTISCGVREARR